jgi:chitinase
MSKGNLWAGYDDEASLRVKVDFVKANKLGGAMIWALDLDDFNGQSCGKGAYPLLRTINAALGRNVTPPPTGRPQPPTAGPQPPTRGPQPPTRGPQPPTRGPQPPTEGPDGNKNGCQNKSDGTYPHPKVNWFDIGLCGLYSN